MVLKEEWSDEYFMEQKYSEYVRLFRFAVARILSKQSQRQSAGRQIIYGSGKE